MGEPSRFEFEVKCGSRLFLYGFEVTQKLVVSEWLFEWIADKWELWFRRLEESKSWEIGNINECSDRRTCQLNHTKRPQFEDDTPPDSR